MQITQINIYPVKSLRGITLHSTIVEPRGLQYDRRWMLVDEQGLFLTQREFPEMALLVTEINDHHLVIKHSYKSYEPLLIPLKATAPAERVRVQVWNDHCHALAVSPFADQWLSEVLQTPCRLVYMPDDSVRPTDPLYSQPSDMVSFADGFPILIIGEASLEDLNQRLKIPVPMNRFRPNLVFSGGKPYEEDTWKNFQIGNLHFRGTKTCGRCEITTIDQATAERGSEPLKTLASYRLEGKRILFGMNVCWNVEETTNACLSIGDSIKIL
ncbi:MAG: MOSC domain-containing protein [Saprospiraceae bacterium]